MPSFIEVEINKELFGIGIIIDRQQKAMVILLPFCGIMISPENIRKRFFYFHK